MKHRIIICLLLVIQLITNSTCLSESFYFDFSEQNPSGSNSQALVREVTLCYLSDEASEMTYVTRTFPADTVDVLISSMLSNLTVNSYIPEVGNSQEAPLPRYELSCGTLTLNLSIDTIGNRTEQELMLICASLANSFLDLDEITAVNILFGNRSFSVSGIPIGVFTNVIEGTSLLYAESESIRSAVASSALIPRKALVYYPALESKYVIPAVREVSVTDTDCVRPILNALSMIPEELQNICITLPRFTGLLLADPEISTTNMGERMVRLSFDSILPDFLTMSGITAESFYISVALSLFSFLPDVSFIQFCVGNEPITSVPVANGKTLSNTNGCVSREDLTDAIGSTAVLYMVNSSNQLTTVPAVMGCHSSVDPIGILSALFETHSIAGLTSVVPEGIDGSDILSITANGSSVTIDLSANFYTRCQELDETQERNLVYAIINTLCELTDIKSVRCTIEGKDMDCFVHNLHFSSYLMPDPGMIIK